ncbi:MAG TPA: hypothetical protein DEQ02_03360 [Ruminococcaceae bacterium]|nr:hypothetical protein [Oscillospiraceae bacterium]
MSAAINTTVSLGTPVTAPCLIPVKHKSSPSCIGVPFMVNGDWRKVTALSFGTPHGAVIVDDLDAGDVGRAALSLVSHCLFPKGASIVFIQMLGRETLKARLWQQDGREMDFTPEAACVAGTAAMMLQKILSRRANVLMGGHMFLVEWDRGTSGVSLTGPARLLKNHGSREPGGMNRSTQPEPGHRAEFYSRDREADDPAQPVPVDDKLISYLEDLSCLAISEDEKPRLKAELSKILSGMASLNGLDTENSPERSHPFDNVNAFREDKTVKSFERELILQNAPKHSDEIFIAPRTVE